MRMLRFEFSKAFWRKSVIIALVLFSLADVWKICDTYQASSLLTVSERTDGQGGVIDMKAVYWQLYGLYGGTITQEKVDRLSERNAELISACSGLSAVPESGLYSDSVYRERQLVNQYFYVPMSRFLEVSAQAASVAAKARENYGLYTRLGNWYDAKKNAYIYHAFSGRGVTEFAYSEGYTGFFQHTLSIVLTALICIFGVVHVFIPEKETRMGLLLLTFRGGGRKLTAAKAAASSVFVAGVTMWFYLLDAAAFLTIYGTADGGGLPLCSFPGFSETLLNLNAFQYAVLAGALRVIGIWALYMLLMFLTVFFNTALVPFVGSLALAAAAAFAGSYFSGFSNPWLKALNPYALLRGNVVLARADFVNLFGLPVPAYQAAVFSSLLTGALSVLMIFAVEKRNLHTRAKKPRGPHGKRGGEDDVLIRGS